jgi:phosphonopyruvate decarboxylase
MLQPDDFYHTLASNGISFFTGVPDSLLKDICAYITDNTDGRHHIIAANEGAAVGIAAGYHLATGEIPLVYMQNSGLGNAVNPLLSLADGLVYSIPMLLMIGWRGEPGVKDEPQHKKQGLVTPDLLEAMQIPDMILSDEAAAAKRQVTDIVGRCREISMPHAILIRKGTFGKYEFRHKAENRYVVSREEALKIVVGSMPANAVAVSTTGKLSRELFEYREALGQGHERDFLTVGSMGHSSSIALGIALEKPERPVYCLDGDGAFLMHTGATSNIGTLKVRNYRHVVFNNGAHESVGGQPTVGFEVDIPAIAKACGYAAAFTAESEEEIRQALQKMRHADGPSLLEIRVRTGSRDNLGRPTTTPVENKNAFMDNLKS